MCFPQFGQLGPLGQHGFARNTAFTVAEETADSVTLVRLLPAVHAGCTASGPPLPCALLCLLELVHVTWQQLGGVNVGCADANQQRPRVIS